MPSITAELARVEAERAELQAILGSQPFVRSPALAQLLSYLCEKVFAGESAQIKEYCVAVEVFGRPSSFDQDSDAIVRVQANRLRKRLAEYYSAEGSTHALRITIPVGQYVPVFEEQSVRQGAAEASVPSAPRPPVSPSSGRRIRPWVWFLTAFVVLVFAGTMIFLARSRRSSSGAVSPASSPQATSEFSVGLPVGDEVRILAGSSRSYVDRSGKLWSADRFFSGGKMVRTPVQHIWRTQDPAIYRSSRQGDFSYAIPLKRGTYELHLHFAETFYGPENIGGGGEGSRIFSVTANGRPLLSDLDVIGDSGGGRTADVKVFADIVPADDGLLHLAFSSSEGGQGMISGIEIVPGVRSHLRPIRIVARDAPYYSNNSQWWSSDLYFKGGQLAASEQPADGTDDPEFYETERWGHFSYAVPVTPGRYTVTLYFIEHSPHAADYGQSSDDARIFDVFCNGKTIVSSLNIRQEVGENRPLTRKIAGLEPNPQGKLLLEFVPRNHYATISAIEVVPQ